MPNWKKVVVSGSDATLNSLNLTSTGSGQTVLDIQGSQGQLFSITDDLTGDIFSISDISGVPILNVNADGTTTFDGNVTLTGPETLDSTSDTAIKFLTRDSAGLVKFHTLGLNAFNSTTFNTVIGTDSDVDTSGATIIDNIYMTDGVITSHGTRTLTLANLGYTGATNANNFTYTLPAGSSSTRGGFKIGYSESGKNYPVEVSSEKMYVNVPWSDTNTDTNTFRSVRAGSNTLGASETLTLTAGTNVSISESGGTVTFSSTDTNTDTNTQLSAAEVREAFSAGTNVSISAAGVISSTDTDTNTNTVTQIRRDNTGTYRTGNINLVGGTNVSISETSTGVFNISSTDTNTDTNTFRQISAGGNDLTSSERLTLTAGTNVSISESAGEVTISSTDTNTDTNTQLSAAEVREAFSAGTNVSITNAGVISSTDTNTNTVTKVRRDNTGTYRTGNINLVGGTNVSISEGSAGVFTITSTDTNTDTNTFRSVRAGSNTLGASETLTLSAGTNVSISESAGEVTISSTDTNTNTQLSAAEVREAFSAGTNVSITAAGVISSTDTNTDTNTNYYLDGITKSGNTLTFSVNGATNQTYTFGSNAFNSTTYLTTSGKAADSEKVDGINGASLLRSDADDSFSGGLVSTARDEGIFGTYDSYKTDHIWSMGTSYKNHASGTNFGNLYGLAYKHTNNSTGGTMAGGHMMVWCENGTGKSAMGTNIWTSGTVTASGGTSTNWNTAYGYGNHADAGYAKTKSDVGLGSVANESRATILGGNLTGKVNNVAVATVTAGAAAGATANQDSTSTIRSGTTKANVGLGSADNKSSATIRGEITSANIPNNAADTTGNAATTTLAANSTLAGGLVIGTGRNNSANQIVRTQANGYAEFGWINTTSGTAGTIDRVYCSQDGYIRYLSPANFRSQLISAGTNVSISGTGVITSTDTNTNTQLSDSDIAKFGYIKTDTNTQRAAGSGLTLSGNTLSHTDTSSQGSVNGSGRTYIQDITLDTYGHVTGLATATETVVNTDTNTQLSDSDIAKFGYIKTDTNTTYTADGNYGLTLSGTTFRLEDDRRRNSTAADIYTGNTHDYVFFDASHGMRFYTAGSEDMRLDNSGNLHVDADVVAYSTTVSDERLKDNVTTIENPLDKIKALRGVEYDWNGGTRKGKHDLGLIAQEVEKVLPNIVHEHEMPFLNDDEEDETLYKTVDYEKMVAVLIEGMKEQQNQIDSLKSELTEIKGKL